MKFESMLFSKSVVFSFAVVFIVSIVLTFFPLIGTLGFEFSAAVAIMLSILCALTSASLISSNLIHERNNRRLSDTIGSIFIINFLLLLTAFIIGLLSSLIQSDCYIKEGSLFFLLIPAVSMFFSTTVGLLSGYLFGRKGIILALLTILIILFSALWKLYHGVSIFVYNPVFGFFPGPLYDEAIPITLTLIISRIYIVLWGILLLLALRIISGFSRNVIRFWDGLFIIILVIAIVVINTNEPKMGISYTRGYITQNILSDSVETENFIIYYAPGTAEAKNIDLIALDHEWRYNQLKDALEVNPSTKIKSYIYPDVETRKKISGAGETTIANPVHSEIHLIYDSFPHPILKHELVHVMAGEFGNNLLKISPKIGLLEGIAVAVDWRGQRYTPHQWSKAMIDMGAAPEIKDIVGLGFWYAPSQISYTLMGSFSKYLIESYGIEDYKQAYQSGSFSVYNKSIDELSNEWLEYLETIDVPSETRVIAEARFTRPGIFQATCPRKIAGLKIKGYQNFEDENYFGAREYFSDALEFNPSDIQLIKWLAYSHYYDGNYERAAEIADTSAADSIIQKNFLKNIKGNSLWLAGNSEEALEIFSGLTQENLTEDLKRELEIKISAINQDGIVENNIKKFFATRDKVLQLSFLYEIIAQNPNYAPAYYLMGRLFFNEGEYSQAIDSLISANLLSLPTDRLTNENLRLLGISQFADGNYDQAKNTFNYLHLLEDNEAAKLYIQDFIDRTKWTDENYESESNHLN